jgi:hypothetical protein
MILVYGDDSADEKSERVCAVAGVVCDVWGWRSLEREWLVRTNGIPFHANECDSDRGDYKEFSHEENKALFKDLSIMVAQSNVCGLGVAIDLMAARRAFPQAAELAYYRAFMRLVDFMAGVAKRGGVVAEFTFDRRTDVDHNASLLYGTAKEYEPEWSPYLADKINFEISAKNPRLQVADLLARESMKALDNLIGPIKRPVRKSWNCLRKTGRFEAEAYSDEWFNDLKKNYKELEQKVGFCEQDYIKWLCERNRQHSVTSMFLFVRDMSKRDVNADVRRGT